jgi:hypothetical protein
MRRSSRRGAAPCSLADYRLKWVACVDLVPQGPFYTASDEALKAIPSTGTGVYLFCRRHGGALSPQYVGRSKRVRQRIREHLERVTMMRALANGEGGRRIVLVAMVQPRRGQCVDRVAQEVERMLLRHFRDARYDLVNERGTRRPLRTVRWLGTTAYRKLIPAAMTL